MFLAAPHVGSTTARREMVNSGLRRFTLPDLSPLLTGKFFAPQRQPRHGIKSGGSRYAESVKAFFYAEESYIVLTLP
jgi:hypothetical protein